jgi:hypothetical protein
MTDLPDLLPEAGEALDRVILLGAECYQREKMLPRLLPHARFLNSAHPNPDQTGNLVTQLQSAIDGERQRGNAGHWTFSESRLIGLLGAHRAETERLNAELAYLDPNAGEGEV